MTCQQELRQQGKPYPRTCAECGLGPCKKLTPAAPSTARTDLDNLVADIEAGLEGVTPGPWRKGNLMLFHVFTDKGADNYVCEAYAPKDATHIARLDPATIRALLAERATLKAENARLRNTALPVSGITDQNRRMGLAEYMDAVRRRDATIAAVREENVELKCEIERLKHRGE